MFSKFSTLSSRSCGPSLNAVKSSGWDRTRPSISTECGLRRALEGIDGQVEQDLDDIGPVHAHGDVLGQRADGELVVLQARDAPGPGGSRSVSSWLTPTRGASSDCRRRKLR